MGKVIAQKYNPNEAVINTAIGQKSFFEKANRAPAVIKQKL